MVYFKMFNLNKKFDNLFKAIKQFMAKNMICQT